MSQNVDGDTSNSVLEINYKDLIDPKQIIRTGETIIEAISTLSNHDEYRASLQQFLDSYATLLPDVVDTIKIPSPYPFENIADKFPSGSPQPVWASILRTGNIVITSDKKGSVKLFLQGKYPNEAFETYYPIIRHPLNCLLPKDGTPLNIEVYAYENDYETCQLRLNTESYRREIDSFPNPSGKAPLDLEGLRIFFDQGGIMTGGRIDNKNGLTLIAQKGPKPTIAGNPITLADFAVAYRAAFHAGDNEAFISLDPNVDSTKTTVNFGGLLEDTNIGAVVLEADKRFKTITSGLDPNSFKDLRQSIRKIIPYFMTVSEQEILDQSKMDGNWIGTRFWFYPESVEIETDLDYHFAMIKNAQFTADAERSREDFLDPQAFEQHKKDTLSPSIRHNIDDLNDNYTKYSNIFRELEELSTVARLMGICSWLKRSDADSLIDLDSLLSVELPSKNTDRVTTQMIAVASVNIYRGENISRENVASTPIIFLSPLLDEKINVHLTSGVDFAKYLCLKYGHNDEEYRNYLEEGETLYLEYSDKKIRDLISNEKDLQGIAEYLAKEASRFADQRYLILYQDLGAEAESLDKLSAMLDTCRETMNVNDYNNNVDTYNNRLKLLDDKIDYFNSVQHLISLEIGGGIDLEHRNFKISPQSNSDQLRHMKETISQVKSKWDQNDSDQQLIINSYNPDSIFSRDIDLDEKWATTSNSKTDGHIIFHATTDMGQKYWFMSDPNIGKWRDQYSKSNGNVRQRLFDPARQTMSIVEHQNGRLRGDIEIQIVNGRKINLVRPQRSDYMTPTAPPNWN